jgi:Holliday junction resolvase
MGARSTGLERDIIEFLRKLGYDVTAPKLVRGNSGYDQQFDILAVKGNQEILFDISAESEVGADRVVAFFAKIFDTKPQRPILICVPNVNRDARNLIAMYKIEAVIAQDKQGVLQRLSDVLSSTRSNS